ncbi:hypothetical protein ACFSKU_09630 [Pontibacter silvestris]|uniref:SbsA Ig-like domain-containing protein n=1 Tax=Pontibacter silvestris TaxID=2305183 RepID=A0ABW4WY33_9BACT|nr:hypothetical protein [Pontibacter silvestris]MCC9137574.1 hypothetical protein [Pontibacter silvestris]
MKNKNVRLLFFIVGVIFFLELTMAMNYTEPFPAILYPGFADIPLVNSPVQKPKIFVFFNENDSVEISKDEFFYHLSDVNTNVILRENFRARKSFLNSSKDPRELEFTVGVKKFKLSLEGVKDSSKIEDGISWTKKRATEVVGRGDIRKLEVQWYSYNLSDNEEGPLVGDVLMEKFIVPFN